MLLKNQKLNWRSFSAVLAAPVPSVSSPSCDSIAVSWKAVCSAAVPLMRSDGLDRMLKENTTSTSLILAHLDPGTLYTTKSRAWNVNGVPGDDFMSNQRRRKKFPFLKRSITKIKKIYPEVFMCMCDCVMFFKDILGRFSDRMIFTPSQRSWKLRWHAYV